MDRVWKVEGGGDGRVKLGWNPASFSFRSRACRPGWNRYATHFLVFPWLLPSFPDPGLTQVSLPASGKPSFNDKIPNFKFTHKNRGK